MTNFTLNKAIQIILYTILISNSISLFSSSLVNAKYDKSTNCSAKGLILSYCYSF